MDNRSNMIIIMLMYTILKKELLSVPGAGDTLNSHMHMSQCHLMIYKCISFCVMR